MSRILIVDDDKAVLNYFQVLLAQARRFEVETLNESARAFDTLAAHAIGIEPFLPIRHFRAVS